MAPGKNLKNWPEKLPKSARKTIFSAVIAVLMIIIFSFWLLSLKNTLAPPQKNSRDDNFETIQKDLGEFLGKTKDYLGQAKDRINQAADQTGAAELSGAEVEKIKDRLMAKETGDWQIYLDNNYNFEIKYPKNWQMILAPKGQELIVRFRRPADSADSVAIKKYASAADILNLPNAEKYWPINGGQLVIFDYLNNTTSDLLINTFKLIK